MEEQSKPHFNSKGLALNLWVDSNFMYRVYQFLQRTIIVHNVIPVKTPPQNTI